MKKKLLILLLSICSVVATATFVACESGGTTNTPPIGEKPIETPEEDEKGRMWTVSMPNGVQYQNIVNVPSISIYEECKIQAVETVVTFTSSAPDVASVSSLGVVRGLKAGTAVVTMTGKNSVQQIRFTVNESGNVPQIVLENTNVPKNDEGVYTCDLFVGGAMNVGAKLKYNGLSYASDVTLSYESEDREVATVDKGVVRALKEGTTTVSVTATEWRGYTGQSMTQTIIVTVKPIVSISVEEEVELYTKALKDGQSVSHTLTPIAFVNDEEVNDASFTYDFDESIVNVSATGEVTSVAEGETTVVVTYTTPSGYSMEKSVKVTVILPVADSDKTFTLDKTGTTLDGTLFNLLTGEKYLRVKDEQSGKEGSFTENTCKATDFPTGDRKLVVYTNKQGYRVTALVVDKLIKTAADLTSLCTTKDVSAYYVLGANIALTGEFAGITTGTFTGIFDGKGYSISGATFVRGLLGTTANNVTVRNLAIENCSANGRGTNGAIAVTIAGSSVLENLYVNLTSANDWSANTATIAYSVKGSLTAKNIVAYRADPYSGAAFIKWTESNLAVISGTNAHAGTNKGTANVTTNSGSCTGVENYATLAAMKAAYANKSIDISWAKTFSFYQAMQAFLGA